MAAKEELKVTDVTSTLIEEEQRKGGPPNSDRTLMANNNHKHFGTGPPGRKGPNRDRREGSDNRACSYST